MVSTAGVRLTMRDLGFKIGFAGAERITDRPAHAVSNLHLAHPYSLAAVGVMLDAILHREHGGGAMMMGNIPLDAAGDPGADETDQSGLDDVLAVNEIVVVGFVDALKETATESGRTPIFMYSFSR